MPELERAAEGVLNDVFCQREVVHAKDPCQRGNQLSRLSPEKMVVEFHGLAQLHHGTDFYGTADVENRTA